MKRLVLMLMTGFAVGCSGAAEPPASSADTPGATAAVASSPDPAKSTTTDPEPAPEKGAVTLSSEDAKAVGDILPAPNQDIEADPDATSRTAVFAGGCFWCTEAVFEQLDGVSEVVSGYAGGDAETANYKAVASGRTRHAEAIAITYNPQKITFGQLLRIHFATHDPTTKNRQGADVGPQYRSTIFFADDEEKKVTAAYIEQLNATDKFPGPIVTTLEPLEKFYPAEEYHQNYAERNPLQPYVQHVAMPKVDKVRSKFKDQLKDAQ